MEFFTIVKNANNVNGLFFQVSELLILYQFSHISLELPFQKYFEIVDIDLLIDSLNDLLDKWLDKSVLELTYMELLVVHIYEFVVEIFISFLKI